MTTFRVGQRVRIKWAATELGRPYVGKAGVINSVREGVDANTGLNSTGYGLDISPEFYDGKSWRNWTSDQLEPLTDSIDHGESDPIPFDLGSWVPVADAIRRDLERQMGRAMTDVEVMA